jgi:hypothetical protein
MSNTGAEAQMEKIGDLPNGQTLYYAAPDVFGGNAGFKVWDPVKGDHVDVELVGITPIERHETPKPPLPPSRPTLGRIVWYRSKTGNYDLPAIITATAETLDPTGVELGHVPALTGYNAVHLSVQTCGLPGTARPGNEPNPTIAGGTYPEYDIPQAEELDIDEVPAPGTWRWPARV